MPIRFATFPSTQSPPPFVPAVVSLFESELHRIGTEDLESGLDSDEVLDVLRSGLQELKFKVETGKRAKDKIMRPVFFGENARPGLQFQIDAWQPDWGLD
ncbi:hypothetical protein [Candidatus Poriferisodalis sp.]|uniref:hypothetical protein n=1 Tax=Candidatus Poriferisodalis sp. TaxID=3101277 RepID=UPI003B027C08